MPGRALKSTLWTALQRPGQAVRVAEWAARRLCYWQQPGSLPGEGEYLAGKASRTRWDGPRCALWLQQLIIQKESCLLSLQWLPSQSGEKSTSFCPARPFFLHLSWPFPSPAPSHVYTLLRQPGPTSSEHSLSLLPHAHAAVGGHPASQGPAPFTQATEGLPCRPPPTVLEHQAGNQN